MKLRESQDFRTHTDFKKSVWFLFFSSTENMVGRQMPTVECIYLFDIRYKYIKYISKFYFIDNRHSVLVNMYLYWKYIVCSKFKLNFRIVNKTKDYEFEVPPLKKEEKVLWELLYCYPEKILTFYPDKKKFNSVLLWCLVLLQFSIFRNKC